MNGRWGVLHSCFLILSLGLKPSWCYFPPGKIVSGPEQWLGDRSLITWSLMLTDKKQWEKIFPFFKVTFISRRIRMQKPRVSGITLQLNPQFVIKGRFALTLETLVTQFLRMSVAENGNVPSGRQTALRKHFSLVISGKRPEETLRGHRGIAWVHIPRICRLNTYFLLIPIHNPTISR